MGIEIDVEKCKGCGLCVSVCSREVLKMSEKTNDNGYGYPVVGDGCIGCGDCYVVCPDSCIVVYRD